VIIGAGMGGLAAAGAVAPFFDKVTVVERDALPESPVQRLGTLQGRHVHALLVGGQRALESLLPGFTDALIAGGAVATRANLDGWVEMPGYDPFPRRDFGWLGYWASRPLLEFTARNRAERANVEFRDRCRARSLEADAAGGRIAAVEVETETGQTERLAADMVIDASSGAGPTLRLLEALGRQAPGTTTIGVDFAYATAVFDIPQGASDEWKFVLTQGRPPENLRGALLGPLEHGRWILSVGGRAEDAPPDDPEAFMAYLQGLRTPTIYEAVRGATRIGEIARYGFRESIWRRFHDYAGLPAGLIPFADSISRFNPVYGQGMTVAALEGVLLKRLLAEHAGDTDPIAATTAAFLTESESIVRTAWDMSAIPDFIFPTTRGERPANFDQIIAYAVAFIVLAARDADVHRLDSEVRSFLKPPSALADPEVIAKVMAVMAEQRAPA
jgi:2-polyprenyl-6-methoxyphenol hydroxylase-like FAD-dependent oxidoreductase